MQVLQWTSGRYQETEWLQSVLFHNMTEGKKRQVKSFNPLTFKFGDSSNGYLIHEVTDFWSTIFACNARINLGNSGDILYIYKVYVHEICRYQLYSMKAYKL